MTTKQKWVLGLTSVASLMVALDVLVVSTALGTIRQHLHASIGQLEWTVNAYALSFAVLLMTASAIGDRFGRRRVFAAGLGLFVAASVACALATSIGWLIAARAIQGASGAIVQPLAISLLSAAFPPERRGQAIGIFGGITGLAVLGGPVVGGAITQGLAWQWVFWLNVPIGLLAIPLVLARMQESYGPRAKLDVPGLALVTGAALGIVWGLVRANSVGWGSAEVLGTLAGGVVLAVAFVATELHTREPMLPMRLFRSRTFATGNAANFLMFGALFSAVFFMAQFQQTRAAPVAPARRAAARAVDRDGVRHRPARRPHGRPHRRAAVRRRRPADAGRGARLGRVDRAHGAAVRADDPAARDRRGRHLDGDPRDPERDHERCGAG